MIFRLILVFTILSLVQSQPIQKLRLRFKVSGHGLPDKDNFGTTDPYVEIFYTQEGSSKEHKLGRSDTITDTENPAWGNIFEFDYDRAKGQRWHFKVYDHDNAREDDNVGKAWVIVDDYVDRGQVYTVNLHKKGTLTIQTVDPPPAQTVQQVQQIQPVQPVQPVAPLAPIVQQPTVQNIQPIAPLVQQVQPAVIQPQRLRIKLSARGLPDTDLLGTIDPYIKAFFTDDSVKSEQLFGRTAPVNDNENPNFKEVLEFDYVRGKNQKWHFLILDDDENRRDDEGGQAFLDADDYVKNGENSVLNLAKGTLIVQRA